VFVTRARETAENPHDPSAAELQPKEKSRIHRRGTEFAEFGVLLDKILFSAHSASPR